MAESLRKLSALCLSAASEVMAQHYEFTVTVAFYESNDICFTVFDIGHCASVNGKELGASIQ